MWTAFKFFVGSWQGSGTGKPGSCLVERVYEFVLNDKFLHIKNKSTFPARGQVHEDWGFFNHDDAAGTFLYRQFHNEGFVNQYTLQEIAPDGRSITFLAEEIENLPAGFRGRETYKIASSDEFVEIFELAAPGQRFEVYMESHLRRK